MSVHGIYSKLSKRIKTDAERFKPIYLIEQEREEKPKLEPAKSFPKWIDPLFYLWIGSWLLSIIEDSEFLIWVGTFCVLGVMLGWIIFIWRNKSNTALWIFLVVMVGAVLLARWMFG